MLRFPVVLIELSFVPQIIRLRHVEVHPHQTIVGQRRENIAFFDQTPELIALTIDDPVKGRNDIGKAQFGFRQL